MKKHATQSNENLKKKHIANSNSDRKINQEWDQNFWLGFSSEKEKTRFSAHCIHSRSCGERFIRSQTKINNKNRKIHPKIETKTMTKRSTKRLRKPRSPGDALRLAAALSGLEKKGNDGVFIGNFERKAKP